MLNEASVRSVDPRVEFGGTPILLPFCSLARGEEELRLRPREGSTDGLALIPVSRPDTDRERQCVTEVMVDLGPELCIENSLGFSPNAARLWRARQANRASGCSSAEASG